MSNPTPGPWKAAKDPIWIDGEFGGQRMRPIEAQGGTVALVPDDEGDDECAANIHLVESALGMQDALRLIDREVGQLDAHCQPPVPISHATIIQLLAALARSEGRS